jgi:AraC-like DNA-binding protein
MIEPEYLELPAPKPLDALIHCFWFLRGPMEGAEVQSVVPDGRMEIVLHLGEPFAEVGADGVARPQATALVAGQLTAPFRLLPRGPADVVGIRFRSEGARSVLGFPADEVNDQVAPLGEICPGLAGKLLRAASRHSLPGERVLALAGVLSSLVRHEPPPLVTEVVRRLDTPRSPAVHTLSAQLGVTRRTLERRVRAEVGLSPRMLSRVLRFRRAFRMLDQAPAGTSARIATAAGYFDQAHLIRDFRRFAGAPPAAFLASDPALTRALLGSDQHTA